MQWARGYSHELPYSVTFVMRVRHDSVWQLGGIGCVFRWSTQVFAHHVSLVSDTKSKSSNSSFTIPHWSPAWVAIFSKNSAFIVVIVKLSISIM